MVLSDIPLPPSDKPNQEEEHSANVNQGTEQKTTIPNPPTSPESQLPRKTINEKDTDQDKGHKPHWVQIGLFLATLGAFIAATIYAGIAYRQWCTMNKTFREVEKQTQATIESSKAAKKSAEIAEKTMIATQRPWVSVRLALGSGLKFEEQGGNIAIVFRLKNVGNSPAVGIHIDARVVLGFGPKEAITEQKTMIAARKYGPPIGAPSFGYALFPGEDFTYQITFGISREQIKKYQTEIVDRFKRGNPDIPNIAKGLNGITPSIVGCVVYGFSFDESVHKTGFFGEVFRIDPLHPGGRYVIDPADGDVPPNLLILHASEFGSYAD